MENKEIPREKTSKNLTLTEKQVVKWTIHDLFLQGLNNKEIHKELEKNSPIKLSYASVNKYVLEIIDEQNERREKFTDRVYTVAFMKVEYLEKLAFKMLTKSEQDKLKTATKTRTKGKGKDKTVDVEKLEEVMSSTGDIRILEFLRQCNRDRMEILRNGKFNAPEETTQQFIQQNNFYNYDVGYRAVEMEPIKTK